MKILISNDDGIFAPGIKELTNHLAECGHDVYVTAPDREQSTTSQSLTLHKPLRPTEANIFSSKVKKAWHVNGTPCDSVKMGIGVILAELNIDVDVVVSGINRGPNLGTDVIYSGTVSAAIEGSILGKPAIAVSLASFEDKHYHTAAIFIGNLLNKEKEIFALPKQTILNVNVPPLEIDEVAGVRITHLGLHRFRDLFEKRTDLRGKVYYWQAGIVEESHNHPDSDVIAVNNNFISVTPIHYDLTSYDLINSVKDWHLNP